MEDVSKESEVELTNFDDEVEELEVEGKYYAISQFKPVFMEWKHPKANGHYCP